MSSAESISNPTKDEDRFPSLAFLRAAHSEMLKLHRERGNDPEVLAKIERLIDKGQATGALLENDDDRWAAQSLLDYWNSLLYRAGHEVSDVTLIDFDPSLASDDLDLIDTTFSDFKPSIDSKFDFEPPTPTIVSRKYSVIKAESGEINQVPQAQISLPSAKQQTIENNKYDRQNTLNIKRKSAYLIISATILTIPILTIFSKNHLFLPNSIPTLSPIKYSPVSPIETDVAYSPEGNNILTYSKRTARLRNIQGKLISVIGKEGDINRAVFSPDSKLIATVDVDGSIETWDYQGKRMRVLLKESSVNNLLFSPDSKLIATTTSDNSIQLLDIKGKLISNRKDKEKIVNLTFSPDSKYILTANENGTIYRWDLKSQNPNLTIETVDRSAGSR